LDMIVISRDVEGASCEELVWLIKLVFTMPFYNAFKAQPVCLLDCYIVGL
jgi:hypothetical protein